MAAHSSPNDIIETFNHFFTNIPSNKSFDMSYKVYIRELADTEDRTISARSSSANLQTVSQPVTIASHGTVPTMSLSSTKASIQQEPLSSATNLTLNTLASSKSTKSTDVTSSQIERLCVENMNRKQRSMIDLTEFNQKFGNGFQPPPPSTGTPPTVYENLNVLSKTTKKEKKPAVSPAPSTFTKDNYGRLVESDSTFRGSDGEDPLYVKVADCFD
ncbi:hypothetical protein L3Y34_018328 [Caenorhabditis briggsae]|uniref:Uncharacterized protein n=3 Tax=Caenorhabditis briggsae TaxID=6238 RepID=A0AAE9DLK8_CAEBR|nr:hypothetical protein L3Y34_018328 [Caenorhabditis briggsae]